MSFTELPLISSRMLNENPEEQVSLLGNTDVPLTFADILRRPSTRKKQIIYLKYVSFEELKLFTFSLHL
jgi:hypothetical protein